MNPANRVRILPNRNSLGVAALVLAMWYAGASQSNGAAYLLCFALIGVAMVSTIHAWANLRGLSVTSGAIQPVFAGDDLRVPLVVRGSVRLGHAGLHVRARPGPSRVFEWTSRLLSRRGLRLSARPGPAVALGEVRPDHPQRVELAVRTSRRGCFSELAIEITSLYPLGFFTASVRIAVAQAHWVYPRPYGRLPLPHALRAGREHRSGLRVEGDDFAGVRPYRRGESQRHIDWKAVARGQTMLVKQWAGQADETLHFDWDQLSALEPEPRLSQLARWIILAERRGDLYSLRLPGWEVATSGGESHMHVCLRALAGLPG